MANEAPEYPKTMQSKTGQSVVVANEEQEIALPSDYGGKAKGKSYAEATAAAKDPNQPFGKDDRTGDNPNTPGDERSMRERGLLPNTRDERGLTPDEKREQETLEKLSKQKR